MGDTTMKTKEIIVIAMTAILMTGFPALSDDKVDPKIVTDLIVEDTVTTKPDTTVKVDSSETGDKIIAYYFHGTRRCTTCRNIEAYSKEAIETKFQKELESGKLEFHPINFDEEENQHFIKDYGLYTKSLIICDYEKGKQTKWKNLDKVWNHVRNKNDFLKYVQDEISAYLVEE